MSFFKVTHDGYILGIGVGGGGTQISEAEYNEILSVIDARPTPQEGYDYRLKTDLTWELFELPPEPDELDEAEAFDIIFGGAE